MSAQPEPATRTWNPGEKCTLPAGHTGEIVRIIHQTAHVKRSDGRERTYHVANLSEYVEPAQSTVAIGDQVVTPGGDNRRVEGLEPAGYVQVESRPDDVPGIGNPTFAADVVTPVNHAYDINQYVVTPTKRLARVVAVRGDEVHTMLRNGELFPYIYTDLRMAEPTDFVREIDNLSAMLDASKRAPVETAPVSEPAVSTKSIEVEIDLNTTAVSMEERLASGWRVMHMQFNEAGDLRCVFQKRAPMRPSGSAIAKAEAYVASLTEPAIIDPIIDPSNVSAETPTLRSLLRQGYTAREATDMLVAPAYQRAAANMQARRNTAGTAEFPAIGAQ